MVSRRLLLVGVLPLAGCAALGSPQPDPRLLAAFTTPLAGRSRGQRHNARWAVRRLAGAVIPAASPFSFNAHVGAWTREQGVVRAPVSYGGILVPSWGGGVCQVSTTLYCAALIAGLDVVERHPHAIAPTYIPAGMDAAVAFGLADLKLVNPYPFAVRVGCHIEGDLLTCELWGRGEPVRYRLVREPLSRQEPPLVTGAHPQPGRAGERVRLWRVGERDAARQLCHESEYAPLPRSG